ncbi:BRCT domain-containing protein [Microbacterium enclense]|uniref:BRCT domain-containing protein n=1 Tax=Microbacterium enclense TaxID=993073 RepID=UPI003F816375
MAWSSPDEFLTDVRAKSGHRWKVDAAFRKLDETPVALDYDGGYWHHSSRRIALDTRKSRDLIAAGWTVVRIREIDPRYPLGLLPFIHPRFVQLQFASPTDPAAASRLVDEVLTKLEAFGRNEMNELIERHGGKASGSVSKNTSLLVAGDGAGSKLARAAELGVRTVTPDEFAGMVGL